MWPGGSPTAVNGAAGLTIVALIIAADSAVAMLSDHSTEDPGPGGNLEPRLLSERSPGPRPSATSVANSAHQACQPPPATEKATSSSQS